MNKTTHTKELVAAAMIAALTCIATMIIKIPSPLKGYINLGDCIVLISGWILSPVYGFFAAGLGSALADLFSGYVIYAPATFMIKGFMALISFFLFHRLKKNGNKLRSRILSAASAELFMILGYFAVEGVMYGFLPSAVNIPANTVQGIAGILLGTVLITALEKQRITPIS